MVGENSLENTGASKAQVYGGLVDLMAGNCVKTVVDLDPAADWYYLAYKGEVTRSTELSLTRNARQMDE